MILNVFSITELFIELVTAAVMAWAGVLSLWLVSRRRRSPTREGIVLAEQKSHLVLLAAVIVLGIRLINWLFFYATLQSFVPDIDGAMCLFGVTRVEPTLTSIAEMLKPISFFLIGFWLVIHMADEKTATSALMDRKLIILSVTAAVVVAESVLDATLILRIAPGHPVTCCTTVTDILDRPTSVVPRSILGPKYAAMLSYAYYAGNLALVAVLALVRRTVKEAPAGRWRRPVLGVVFVCAIVNAGVFLLAQIEAHAPIIMGLPYHRCLYCLWQYVPDTILMYSLFILATASTGWAFLLDLTGRTPETESIVCRYVATLYGVAMFCFAASLIMTAVHVTMA